MAERSTASIIFKAMTTQWQRAMLRVQSTMTKVRARMTAVSSAAKRVLLVGAGAFAVVTRAALKQEKAELLLDAALKTTGHSVDLFGQKLRDAASSMQEVTVHGDEFILELMSMGLNLGLTADNLEESTKQALGLAKALGQDARAGMRNYALAVQGNFLMLARYIPAIRAVETAQEKLIEVNKLAAQGYLQLQAEAETTAGRLIQLWNVVGDLSEKIGDVFLPKVKEMAESMKPVVDGIQKWVTNNKMLILSTLELVAKVSLAVGAVAGLIGVVALFNLNPMVIAVAAAAVAYGLLSQAVEDSVNAQHKMPDVTDSTRRALKEIAEAAKDAKEELAFLTEMQEALSDKEEKRSTTVRNAISGLQLQADAFGMTARELAFYKLSLEGLTEAERAELAQAEQNLRVKEKVVEADKKIAKSKKEYVDALEQQKERESTFNDAMKDLVRTLDVAEGKLTKQEVAIERIAEQYGVTVEEAKKFVALQNSITEATTKEKEERQAMTRIEGPLQVFRRIQAAAARPRVSKSPTSPSGMSTPAQKDAAKSAEESKTILEQILDLFRSVESQLPFAARAG